MPISQNHVTDPNSQLCSIPPLSNLAVGCLYDGTTPSTVSRVHDSTSSSLLSQISPCQPLTASVDDSSSRQ
ncbi:hypothetical protein WN943_015025 [Citrus x changshan-huyou]|uniref:Uncharacterized protein n=2 Tax=Citrus TaxID=2706 RepID=A0A067DDR1_CITSI|nr:hypothetical protein CISIN_1g038227mg [Citrus sinensis]